MQKKNVFEEKVESVEKLSVDQSVHPSVIDSDRLSWHSKPSNEFVIKFDPRLKYSSSDRKKVAWQDVSHAGDDDGVLHERLASNLEVDSVNDKSDQPGRGFRFDPGAKESYSKSEPSSDNKRSDGVIGDIKLSNGIGQDLLEESNQLFTLDGSLSKETVAENSPIKIEMLKDKSVAQASHRLLSDAKAVLPNMHSSSEGREGGVEPSRQKTNILRQHFQDGDDIDGNNFNEEEEDEEGEENEEDDESEDADDEEDGEDYSEDEDYDNDKLSSNEPVSVDKDSEPASVDKASEPASVVEPSHSDTVLVMGGASQVASETSHRAISNDHKVKVHDSNEGAARASLEVLHSPKMGHQAR